MTPDLSISILALGLSPAIQKTILFDQFKEGEVNRAQTYYTDAAGKCINVGRVLVQGSVQGHCLTIAGKENRRELEELCRRDGLPLSTVESQGRVRTCTTIVDQASGQCTELVVNEPELIKPEEEKEFKDQFLKLLPFVKHGIIISGSRLPGFSDEIIPYFVRMAKRAGLVVYADYKGEDLKNSFQSETVRPDFVKINEEEFLATFLETELETGLLRQSEKYNSSFVISRGSESTLAAAEGRIIEIPSSIVKALNPIGCGDSMTAGLAQGISEGLNLEEAVCKGRDYASANVQSIHPGWIIGDKV